MTCCSLRRGDAELLGARHGLSAYASNGVSMGLSLMHPWTDHLSGWSYTAAGTRVRLPVSPLLHTDASGLPVNGVQSNGHAWILERSGSDATGAWMEATLPFTHPRQLALFPFPHLLHLRAEVGPHGLRILTLVEATSDQPVPIAFGYRVYVCRDAAAGRAAVVLPARRVIATDARLIPTGASEAHAEETRLVGSGERIGEVFALGEADRTVRVVTTERQLALEALDGFRFAQVRATPDEPELMLEAMTAEPDALSHDAYALATPGRPYRAELRVTAEEAAPRVRRRAA
jgi:hypothetical protein